MAFSRDTKGFLACLEHTQEDILPGSTVFGNACLCHVHHLRPPRRKSVPSPISHSLSDRLHST
eukprot:scaffold282_cov345-Pavlova_lutheri.AAC.35